MLFDSMTYGLERALGGGVAADVCGRDAKGTIVGLYAAWGRAARGSNRAGDGAGVGSRERREGGENEGGTHVSAVRWRYVQRR